MSVLMLAPATPRPNDKSVAIHRGDVPSLIQGSVNFFGAGRSIGAFAACAAPAGSPVVTK